MQEVQDLLTENQVIEGVQNFLYQKGHTTHRRVVTVADAARKEHGVDLIFKLENDNHKGNTYFIEAKGNLKSDGTPMLSKRRTNFAGRLPKLFWISRWIPGTTTTFTELLCRGPILNIAKS